MSITAGQIARHATAHGLDGVARLKPQPTAHVERVLRAFR